MSRARARRSPQPQPYAATSAMIRVIAGASKGLRVRVPCAKNLTIGRANVADLVINDRDASAKHARLRWSNTELWIQDLDSASGTLVNGCPTKRLKLNSGDVIKIGSTRLEVRITPGSASSALVPGQPRV